MSFLILHKFEALTAPIYYLALAGGVSASGSHKAAIQLLVGVVISSEGSTGRTHF